MRATINLNLCFMESEALLAAIWVSRSGSFAAIKEGFPILKPGIHIVGRIPGHVCDDASKRILKLSTYRLNIFLVINTCDQHL